MQEKLEQCVRMLKYLSEKKYKFYYSKPFHGELELPKDKPASTTFGYMTAIILDDKGELEFVGNGNSFKPLPPNQQIVDYILQALKAKCKVLAKSKIMERLIKHELTYHGINLEEDNKCELTMH